MPRADSDSAVLIISGCEAGLMICAIFLAYFQGQRDERRKHGERCDNAQD